MMLFQFMHSVVFERGSKQATNGLTRQSILVDMGEDYEVPGKDDSSKSSSSVYFGVYVTKTTTKYY